jgi:uncharacterized protein
VETGDGVTAPERSGELLSPFVELLRTPEHPYVYDVNTNVFFRVNEAEYEAFELLGRGLSRDEVLVAMSSTRGEGTARAVLDGLELEARAGYLSSRRPTALGFGTQAVPPKERHSALNQLILGVTEECNLRCHYCVYGDSYDAFRRRSSRRMPPEVARAALELFFATSRTDEGVFVSFYGGEPLLNLPLIRECVRYVQKHFADRNVRFNLTTNGVPLTDEVADFLVRNDFLMRLSLDGPEQLHDANRVDHRGRGSFSAVWENLTQLLHRNPEFCETNVALAAVDGWPFDAKARRAFFESTPELEGLFLDVNGVNPYGTSYFSDYPPPESHHLDELEAEYVEQTASSGSATVFLTALFRPRVAKVLNLGAGVSLEGGQPPLGACAPGSHRLFVDTAGRLLPCERCPDHLVIGDVERGFDELAIARLTDAFTQVCQSRCTACWARRLCTACFSSPIVGRDDPSVLDRYCEIERATTRAAMVTYLRILERNPSAFDAPEGLAGAGVREAR